MKIATIIHKREYIISQETPNGKFSVTGQILTASGALMPRLEEALREYFEKENIPAGQIIGMGSNDPETLIFAFHPGKAQMIAYKAFRAVVEANPIVQDLRYRAHVICRRFRLAELAGLDLSRRRHYHEPLAEIKVEMAPILESLFAEFEHLYKSILAENDGLLWKTWLTDVHDPYDMRRRITLEAGDREWLEMQIALIVLKISQDEIARNEEEW